MNLDDIGTGREEGYFLNVLMALSRLLTAVGCGANHKVYFSSQAGRWLEQGKLRGKFFVPVINRMFRDNRHCQHSWEITRQLLVYERKITNI